MSSCPGCCRGSWGPGFLLARCGGFVRLVVVVGRHWPLLSGIGRPRDGPVAPPKMAPGFSERVAVWEVPGQE